MSNVIQVVMAKHYKRCGESEASKSHVALKSRYWGKQQHIPSEGCYHARFMRSACHPLSLRKF